MLLTVASALSCPHGGLVTAIPSDTSVTLGGVPIVLAADTFLVAGCAFSTPAGPHPCVSVIWQAPDSRSTANGVATLSTDSLGLCMAADGAMQGPVIIQSTQARAQGS